jgi:hypothetical protein
MFGWEKHNVRGSASGGEPWYPTLRKVREGWGTQTLVLAHGVLLVTLKRKLERSLQDAGRRGADDLSKSRTTDIAVD